MIAARILCLIAGYAFGLIQTSYIYGKMNGIDIREHGSGNAGTTNALRVLGKKAGLIVFLGDLLKVITITTIVRIIFYNVDPDNMYLYIIYAGFGAALGHNFPFYMKFKGGKGIAVTAGFVASLLDPIIIMACLVVFFSTLALTKYVSLSSIFMVTTFATLYTIFTVNQKYCFDFDITSSHNAMIESIVVVWCIALMAIIRHRANILRLIKHEENKLSFKK